MDGENAPYRARFPGLRVSPDDDESTQDQQEFSTLEAVYLDAKAELDKIDAWHAFELDEKLAGLTIKQQILAHKIAYDILAPLVETMRDALATVNEKYRER